MIILQEILRCFDNLYFTITGSTSYGEIVW